MHPKKRDNLLKLTDDERVDFFIRYCADFEEVWGLVVGKDNWVTFMDYENQKIFPIWPHHDLAEYCCFEEHKQMKAKPQSIKLENFLKKCVPDMLEQNISFGVFFNLNREAKLLNPSFLKEKLEEEHQSLWG
jgi:hypothetical protein